MDAPIPELQWGLQLGWQSKRRQPHVVVDGEEVIETVRNS